MVQWYKRSSEHIPHIRTCVFKEGSKYCTTDHVFKVFFKILSYALMALSYKKTSQTKQVRKKKVQKKHKYTTLSNIDISTSYNKSRLEIFVGCCTDRLLSELLKDILQAIGI